MMLFEVKRRQFFERYKKSKLIFLLSGALFEETTMSLLFAWSIALEIILIAPGVMVKDELYSSLPALRFLVVFDKNIDQQEFWLILSGKDYFFGSITGIKAKKTCLN